MVFSLLKWVWNGAYIRSSCSIVVMWHGHLAHDLAVSLFLGIQS